MVKITLELLRKRSEHNDSVLDTLEEIALHQYMIRKIEVIGDVCRKLQILLLQNNKIRRIENIATLKELRYLNLAINRITKLENVASLESLEKLDLTANYIHNYRDFSSMSRLSRFTELYVVGNPLTTYPYWREYIINVLPHLEKLDGHEVSRTDRIIAASKCAEHANEIAAIVFQEKNVPQWDANSDNSDYEDKDANVKIKRAAEETAATEYRNKNILPEERSRPSRAPDPTTGHVRQYNELGFDFMFEEVPEKDELCCKIMVPINMQTDALDIDVDPFSVLLISRESKKQMQIAWPYEVFADQAICRRITSTGALKIYARVVNPDALRTGYMFVPRSTVSKQELVTITPAKDANDAKAIGPKIYTQDISDSDIEGRVPSDLPDLENIKSGYSMGDNPDPIQIDEKALAAYDLAIDDAAFAAIERDFHEVLAELVGDSSLDLFRTEYEKLHTALRKSHENEKLLVQRVRELAQNLSINNQKIKTALRLSKEDQSTISSLKAEIDKAWKIVDLAREKEGVQTEQIDKLRAEVQSLRGMIDTATAGTNVGVPEEQNIEDLLRAKAVLQQEYETRGKRISLLREELNQHLDRIKQLESEKVSSELRVRALKEQVAQHRSEAARELQRREHLDRELASLRLKCENLEHDIASKDQDVQHLKAELAKAETRSGQEYEELQKTKGTISSLQDKIHKLKSDLSEASRQSANLQNSNAEKETLIQQHLQEAAQARAEAAKAQKTLTSLQTKLDSLEISKRNTEEKVEQLKNQLMQAEQELKQLKHANNEINKEHDQLNREAQLVGKSLHVAQVSIADKDDLLKQMEGQAKNYEQEILSFRRESQKQRKIIFSLEKERENFSQKSTEAQQKYLQAVQELRVRDLAISDLQKRVSDADIKLKQQQALYESVRSDRNLYSKSLVEAQDEVSELRRKFRVLSHVIDQLKSEIQTKDESLLKEHFAYKSALKEKDSTVQELERTRQQVREAEEALAIQRAEIAKLNCIITESDMERDRQMKEYRIVVSERDILGTQLIRRNDELSLLYERVRVQQATLAKGEKQYSDRIEDIRLLRAKVTDLRRQIVSLRRQAASIEPYKKELYRLQRDLLDERAKTRALSQELQLPVNIHRWRSLEGSDPAAYELIKKTQYLQRRLIQKSEECSTKNLELEEKEKLYNDLKKVLSRQPGSEVLEKLSAYQDALKAKTRQLQTLSSELAMYQTQSSEYKDSIERLTRELQDMKRKYFALKKKEYEQMLRDGTATEGGINGFRPANSDSGPVSKMVGGGFSVTHDGRSTAPPEKGT